jgi:FkbM family methyltransferase
MAVSIGTLRTRWRAFRRYAGRRSVGVALARWAFWALRCALKRPAAIVVPQLQVRLFLPPRWRGCWKAIYVFRDQFFAAADPEVEFTARRLRPGDVFVDAGAFNGWYTLVASRAVGGSGCVLAFEPNPEAFALLARNIELNHARNVQSHNIALSSDDGWVTLFTGPGDGVASSLARLSDGQEEVRVQARRLDTVLSEAGIARVDLMKLDVEGSEAAALRGAASTLKAYHPTVIFEVNPIAARNMNVAGRSAWDVLQTLGYGFFRFVDGRLVPLVEPPAVADGEVVNVIASHEAARRAAPGTSDALHGRL